MQANPMKDAGIIDVARWWFRNYPSDIFIGGEVAEIRKQLACLMIRRHRIRMHNLRQNTNNVTKSGTSDFPEG